MKKTILFITFFVASMFAAACNVHTDSPQTIDPPGSCVVTTNHATYDSTGQAVAENGTQVRAFAKAVGCEEHQVQLAYNSSVNGNQQVNSPLGGGTGWATATYNAAPGETVTAIDHVTVVAYDVNGTPTFFSCQYHDPDDSNDNDPRCPAGMP